jgi:hypothetical protein
MRELKQEGKWVDCVLRNLRNLRMVFSPFSLSLLAERFTISAFQTQVGPVTNENYPLHSPDACACLYWARGPKANYAGAAETEANTLRF